jgi:ubiquinone/menaquinone biosynthesis C-methylase UbiE
MSTFHNSNRPSHHHYGLLILCLLCIPGLAASEQNVNPGINQHYQNPDYDHWVNIFERPGREVYDQREAIVEQLAIQPGMNIADVGAGTGLFSRLFAKQVGERGKIFAVDISANFVENIQRTAQQAGLHNITGIVSNQRDTKLPAHAIDLVFICDTYHHFEYPQTILASIHKALKDNARLAVIDFVKQPGQSDDWIMTHVRADKQTTIEEIQRAGFKLVAEPTLLHSNYFLVFEKVSTSK